jgi:predicted lipoprotein with Yx(FWY)xxD motif
MSRRLIGAYALLFVAVVLALYALGHRHRHRREVDAPLATPPGITLQKRPITSHEPGTPEPEVLYADAQGRTLYLRQSRAKTPAQCDAECAHHWHPAVAARGSEPLGDWTLKRNTDGTLQWTLRGAPLFWYAEDAQTGDIRGDGAEGGLWHAAVFRPDSGLALPAGIEARELPDAGGSALVDAQGLTLYAFLGDSRHPERGCEANDCRRHWLPLGAPAIATDTRDFSVLRRRDGITQWAFRDRALYRFDGDLVPGNANGIDVSPLFRVALIVRYFMPADAVITRDPVLGRILTARGGLTLYQRDRVDASEGGRSFRSDHGAPELGRLFGIGSCDAVCIRQWPVFGASAAAQGSGYWQIALRPEGTRQWVYRGYALYTYAVDRPGETRGNDIYDLAQVGERTGSSAAASSSMPPAPATTSAKVVSVDPAAATGAGVGAMFWHAVVP